MRTRNIVAVLGVAALAGGCGRGAMTVARQSPKPSMDALPAPASPRPVEPPAPAGPPAALPAAACPTLRPDPWWLARHRAIVDAARAGGNEIAFVGDSITQGWEGEGREAWARDWAPRHAVNGGIGGDRTQHVIGRLDDGLLDALAAPGNRITRVVLLIGTNNTAAPADPPEDIAAGVRAIIDRLRARLPGARVTLMAVLPRERTPGPSRAAVEAVNAALAPVWSTPGVDRLDIGAEFVTPGGEIPADLMPDALHLSPAGYERWSMRLRAALGY